MKQNLLPSIIASNLENEAALISIPSVQAGHMYDMLGQVLFVDGD